MAQWLRLCISNARGKVRSQVGEIRSYMLHSVAKKRKKKKNIYMFVCVCARVSSVTQSLMVANLASKLPSLPISETDPQQKAKGQ